LGLSRPPGAGEAVIILTSPQGAEDRAAGRTFAALAQQVLVLQGKAMQVTPWEAAAVRVLQQPVKAVAMGGISASLSMSEEALPAGSPAEAQAVQVTQGLAVWEAALTATLDVVRLRA